MPETWTADRGSRWSRRIGPSLRRLSSRGAGLVWKDRRLANRKPSVRVYLDATGLSIGGVHRAEKEQEGVRASKARVRPAFSGEHC